MVRRSVGLLLEESMVDDGYLLVNLLDICIALVAFLSFSAYLY